MPGFHFADENEDCFFFYQLFREKIYFPGLLQMDFLNSFSQPLVVADTSQSLAVPSSTVASSKSATLTQGPEENTLDKVFRSRAFELNTFSLILILLTEFHPHSLN